MSISKQCFSSTEICFVNDGSTDETWSVVESFSKSSKLNLKMIDFKENKGPGAARNAAIKISSGDLIAVMDADDIMLPTRLSEQVSFMENHRDVDLIGGGQKLILAHGKTKDLYPPTSHNEILSSLFFKTTILHPTIMFRKSFMIKHKIMYEEDYFLGEDYKLFTDFLEAGGRFYNLPIIVNEYSYEETKSWEKPNSKEDENLKKIHKYFCRLYQIKYSEQSVEVFLKVNKNLPLCLTEYFFLIGLLIKLSYLDVINRRFSPRVRFRQFALGSLSTVSNYF